MKKLIIWAFLLFVTGISSAQNTINIHQGGFSEQFLVQETDSMYFSPDSTEVLFSISGSTYTYSIFEIDSITFSLNTDSVIYINYDDLTVDVINPFEGNGVDISVFDGSVVMTSSLSFENVNVVLSGYSSDGFFKLYSEKPVLLILNELNLLNPVGPAINIQSNASNTIQLAGGTENVLTDGAVYDAPFEDEDQDATLFSEGDITITGAGTLTINGNGNDQHAFKSDDIISIEEGTLIVTSAVKDGIHGKDGVHISGGNINVTSDGDGIDGDEGNLEVNGGIVTVNSTSNDVKAMKSDLAMTISGGILHLYVSGDQSKGLKSDAPVNLNGGTIYIDVSGDAVLEASGSGFDPSYCTAVNGNGDINVNGSTIIINATGMASRGLSADGNINLYTGDLVITCSGDGAKYTNTDGEDDAYHGTCLKADLDMYVGDVSLELSNSGSGGKGISVDGNLTMGNTADYPVINLTTTGESIVIVEGGGGPGGTDGEYDEAKAITVDGSILIESGNYIINSADDGIKSKTAVTINGGIIVINDSYEAIESPYITVNDGDITLKATDDGFNATFGYGGEDDDGSLLQINGGYIYISASGGDALDSNGDIQINGGVCVVHGPLSSPEVGMDYNGDCIITGGFLVISGTDSFMTQNASQGSIQPSVLMKTNNSLSAGTIFHLEDSNGNSLLTFAPDRRYYSIVFSDEVLSTGSSYKIYTGGSSSGTLKDGLYTGGTYSGGTLRTTFTLNSNIQTVNF